MRIVLCPTLHEHDREVSLLERLMHGTTDGAILVLPGGVGATSCARCKRQGYPFVVVDPRDPPPEGIPCVSAMHAAGAKQATEHLLELGHRRIGAIAGSPGWYATEERMIGFRGALAAAGILQATRADRLLRLAHPRGIEAAEQLLSLPEPPTAIFGFNDNVAIGALVAARARGLVRAGRPLGGRVRRHVPGGDRHPAAHVGAPAARRDGPDGRQPADAAHRRAARRRGAPRAVDHARRARVDRAAPRESVAAWPGPDRGVVLVAVAVAAAVAVGVGRSSPSGLRRHRLVSSGGVPRARARQGAGQRLGPRRDRDRAVVDDERGERHEHALLGRRAQAGADGERARRADRDRRLRRRRVPRLAPAASPTRRGSSTPVRTGGSAPGRPPSRTSGRRRPRSSVDDGGEAAIFRGVAVAGGRLYATDFHNARVDVFDTRWQPAAAAAARSSMRRSLPGTRPTTSSCSAAICSSRTSAARRSTATTIRRGGYVDEFDLAGRLVARVGAHGRAERAVGARARAVVVRPVPWRPPRGELR